MLLQTLEIENFRNLATQTLEFSDGVNLLCGKNAACSSSSFGFKSFSFPLYSSNSIMLHGSIQNLTHIV